MWPTYGRWHLAFGELQQQNRRCQPRPITCARPGARHEETSEVTLPGRAESGMSRVPLENSPFPQKVPPPARQFTRPQHCTGAQ